MKRILAPLLLVMCVHAVTAQDQQNVPDTITYIPSKIPVRSIQEVSTTPTEGTTSINNRTTVNSQSTATTIELGRTKGSLDVNATGAATWSFNFTLPPGIAGIVPEAGLNYNSQAGNGVAGFGWNVSGLSEITRITSTKFHDNLISPINFNAQDRFALNGQRLILKSGTYGADGAEYVTEQHSNVRIVSRGSMTFGTGTGPAYFEVFYTDGSKAIFGGENGTAAVPTGYNISSYENPQGVKVIYTYEKLNNNLLITSIGYGSRGSASPVNSINFTYRTTNRVEQGFTAGTSLSRNKILQSVHIIANGQPFRNYMLQHELLNYHLYDRLIKITEYNGDNTASFIPVNFTYHETPYVTVNNTIGNLSLSGITGNNSKVVTADFTGNGKMDFILYPTAKNKLYVFWDPDGSTPYYNMGYEMNTSFSEILPMNWLTHNNKILSGEGFGLSQSIYTGGYFQYPPVNGNPPPVKNKLKVTVYSAGTVTPVYYQYEREWEELLGTSVWHSPNTNKQYWEKNPVEREWLAGDFDGDGLSDIVTINKPYTHRQLEVYGNPGSFTYSTYPTARVDFVNMDRRITSNFVTTSGNLEVNLGTPYILKTGDFNGDGKTDIIQIISGTIYVYSFDQNKTLVKLAQTNDSRITTVRPPLTGDFNGDGKMDIMFAMASGSNNFTTFYATGKGFEILEKLHPFFYREPVWNGQTGRMDTYYLIANDIDKDGKSDVLELHTVTTNGSTQGSMHMKTWYNGNAGVSGSGLTFYGTGADANFPGNIIHYPIPVFFSSERPNLNLEFGVLSDNSFSLYTFQKDIRKETSLKTVQEDSLRYTIDYSPLVPASFQSPLQVYSGSLDQTFPNIDLELAPGLEVVSKLSMKFNGHTTQQRFGYRAAVNNTEGLGFLGFSEIIRTNWHLNDNDINRTFDIRVNSPALRGAPVKSFTTKQEYINSSVKNAPVDSDGSSLSDYISRMDYSYNTTLQGNKVYINVPSTVKTKNNLTGTSSSVSFTYDSYQNVTGETKTFGTAGTELVTNTYDNNPTAGYMGRLTNKTVTRTNASDSYTTEEQFTYTGFLPTQIKRRGHNTPFITEDLQYDLFGNVIQKTVTTSSGSRTSSTQFDPSGRFVIKLTAPDGKETNYTYNTSTGNPLTKTDPDNKTTNYIYDSWGRWIEKTDFLGLTSNRSFTSANGFLTIEETNAELMLNSTTFNSIGQVVEVRSKDVKGQITGQAFQYDAYGRKYKESQPAINGNYTQWDESSFDQYGRLSQVSDYTGKNSLFTYSGLSTTVNDGTRSVTTIKNALGQVVSLQDPGGTISYIYFSNGNLKTTSYNGLTQTIEQDGWGRKTKITDPSAGIYTYTYNGFGEVTNETTPKGSTDYTYDALGKMLTKEIQGDNTDMSYVYTYHPTTKMLSSLQLTNADGNNTEYIYTYDNHHRITNMVEDNTLARFSKTFTYTNTGRINTLTNEAKHKGSNITVSKTEKYQYTNGQLSAILDNATQQELWKVNTLNARGQFTGTANSATSSTRTFDQYGYPETFTISRLSNAAELMQLHFTYNAQLGNMNTRVNDALGWSETFAFDNLDRLTDFNDNDGNQQQLYDNQGRISSIGQLGTITYSGNSYQPSAINNLTSFADSYYQGRALQQINYNAFKSPVSITEPGKETVSFQYNASLGRAHMHYGGTQTNPLQRPLHRHYSEDGSMEITHDAINNKVSFVFYVGGNAYTAPLIWKSVNTGGNVTDNFYYLHRDQLGSILLITDQTGNIQEKRQFNAWGKLVRLTDGANNPLTTFVILDRGFTSHEHLSGVQLIHMNRRLYDPVLHRFLSPDNFVQDPGYSQSFNRYGYALNNPLKYTDESGDFFFSWIMGFVSGTIKGGFKEGWREANKRMVNEFRLIGGLFTTDPNKSLLGRVGELFSRFTWQLPQTIGGYLTSASTNTFGIFGGVESVDYLYGATVVQTRGNGSWGMTQSNFIIGSNQIRADANNPLFQHEYGHYLQSQRMGFAYYSRVGFPSLFSEAGNHDFHPVEQDANRLAFIYFNKQVSNFQNDSELTHVDFLQNKGWDYQKNKIYWDRSTSYRPSPIDPNNPDHMKQLNNLRLSATWYDHAGWLLGGYTGSFMTGLYNTLKYNN